MSTKKVKDENADSSFKSINDSNKIEEDSNILSIIKLLKHIDFKTWIIIILSAYTVVILYWQYDFSNTPEKGNLKFAITKCTIFLPEDHNDPSEFQFETYFMNDFSRGISVRPIRCKGTIMQTGDTVEFYPITDNSLYLNPGQMKILTFLTLMSNEKLYWKFNQLVYDKILNNVLTDLNVSFLVSTGQIYDYPVTDINSNLAHFLSPSKDSIDTTINYNTQVGLLRVAYDKGEIDIVMKDITKNEWKVDPE